MRLEKGRFKEKHVPGLPVDPEIAQAVQERVVNGMITCADAAAIASELHKPLSEIGIVIDILELPLSKCQLGLFGYDPQKKIVTTAVSVAKELESAIREKLLNGMLSCDATWKTADALALPRITVSSACEALHVKIKPCQLGAF